MLCDPSIVPQFRRLRIDATRVTDEPIVAAYLSKDTRHLRSGHTVVPLEKLKLH